MLRSLAALWLAIWLVLSPGIAAAQTATVDWGTAGAASLTAMPNPTNIAATDGTAVAVNYSNVISGTGSFVPTYGGSFVSYYSGTVGSVTGVMLLNFDNSSYDPNDKITTNITLGRNVKNLQFKITDIDSATNGWIDALEVYYDDGSGIFQNAATNAAFWTANSAITRTNNSTVNGWRGTGTADQLQTFGDLSFNFGTTTVKRIRIVYFSYIGPNGTSSDPSAQYGAVSGLTFDQNADLSLTKSLIGPNPVSGGSATFRLTLTNAASSTRTASSVTVKDYMPAGFVYSSSSGSGTFSPATGIWTLTNVAPGNVLTLDITGVANVSNGTVVTNTAEIFTSSESDNDSTPGNGVITEDDYASASFTVTSTRVAGTPPVLSCSAGEILYDWDTRIWTAGATSNPASDPLGAAGNISFSLANPGIWVNDPVYGGQSPRLQSVMTGGLSPAQKSLIAIADLASNNDVVTTTITLPEIMQGAQFKIFDVDFSANQFADRMVVTGSLNGVTVLPALTTGRTNYLSGTAVFGDGISDDNSADGNVTVTFSSPIDKITIVFGNQTTAPSNPGPQSFALHDLKFCLPTTNLVAAKTSTIISDPVNLTNGPKAIPGATIRYCIVITNAGVTKATNVIAADNLPANITYLAESMKSGTTCANAATVEDDNNTGADESDPVGASRAANTLSITTASLAASSAISLTFDGTIN